MVNFINVRDFLVSSKANLPSEMNIFTGKLFLILITESFRIFSQQAAMAECLSCLACTNKVLCVNLGATRHRMTLDKSLEAVCLGPHPRMMHTDYV